MSADKKKMGRPTDDPKPIRRCYRLSEGDMDKIKFCKEITGLTEAEIIRRGLDNLYKELKGEKK